MSVLWLMNANMRNTPLERPKQNGPGIAPGAVFDSESHTQAATPFAFSTYSSIWLKFRYL